MDLSAILELEIAEEELPEGEDSEDEIVSSSDSGFFPHGFDRSTDVNDEWNDKWVQFMSSSATLQSAWEEQPQPFAFDDSPHSEKEILACLEGLEIKVPFFTATASLVSEEDRREVASSLQSVIDAIVYQFEVFNKESILFQTNAHSINNASTNLPQRELSYSIFDEAKEMELLREGSELPSEEYPSIVYQFYEGVPEVEEHLSTDVHVSSDHARLEEEAEPQLQVQSDRAQRLQRKHRRRLMEEEARRRRLMDNSAVH